MEDPDRESRRHRRDDGVTIDYSATGLFVAYRETGPDSALLLRVRDLKRGSSL